MNGQEEWRCVDCGRTFYRDAPWKVRCLACFKRSRGVPDQPTHQATPAFDKTRLRELLQLCHPDKHGGSDLAVRTTQWLLSLRNAGGGR